MGGNLGASRKNAVDFKGRKTARLLRTHTVLGRWAAAAVRPLAHVSPRPSPPRARAPPPRPPPSRAGSGGAAAPAPAAAACGGRGGGGGGRAAGATTSDHHESSPCPAGAPREARPAPRGKRRADRRHRQRARAASVTPASHRPSLSTSQLNQIARVAAQNESLREAPSRSPFEKSLRKVPSRSPFGNVPSVRSARARLARSARATAPRAAVRGGRPRSLRVRPRAAADWRTQERDFAKPRLHPVLHFTYINTVKWKGVSLTIPVD
eukprot:scaffold3433_cov62-Phaeocystis_antarctica.AAC.2